MEDFSLSLSLCLPVCLFTMCLKCDPAAPSAGEKSHSKYFIKRSTNKTTDKPNVEKPYFHILLFPRFSSSIFFTFFYIRTDRTSDTEAGKTWGRGHLGNKNHTNWCLLKHNKIYVYKSVGRSTVEAPTTTSIILFFCFK